MTHLTLFLASATLLVSAGPSAQAAPAARAEVCHGGGAARLLQVSGNAIGAHLRHGDVLPGDWYPDADGDGFGDPGATPADCPAAGLVDNADDCDDSDPAVAPDQAELDDGLDNDCDGWTDEDFTCPCFDEADLDALLAGWQHYALMWDIRADGRAQVTSLRGYNWEQNSSGGWQAPTVGADLYRTIADGGAPSCEVWDDTWLAAPTHGWAGTGSTDTLAIAEESVSVCQGVLNDWIGAHGVTVTSF